MSFDRSNNPDAFAEEEFAARGLPARFPQCNLSRNMHAGTLRGVHYNAAPHRETKLVRCTSGAIWDVVVDVRSGSSTRLQWFGMELSAARGDALFVPEGYAHGFITLRDATDVFYHMSRPYAAGAARGLRWNDPRLGIEWPVLPTIMSDQDRAYPDYNPATFDG